MAFWSDTDNTDGEDFGEGLFLTSSKSWTSVVAVICTFVSTFSGIESSLDALLNLTDKFLGEIPGYGEPTEEVGEGEGMCLLADDLSEETLSGDVFSGDPEPNGDKESFFRELDPLYPAKT